MKVLQPNPRTSVYFSDPPIARFLFSDTRSAWIWVLPRLYVAYVWLSGAWSKITNPAWFQSGEALHKFWMAALTDPKPAIYFDWYRNFIQYMVDIQAWTWFSKVIMAGELLVGLSILFGAFVGVGAFAGAFMNWNYLLAGTTSTNPVLLLPLLGTPWAPAREIQAEMPLSEKQPTPKPS